jgi:hypothetical protein
MAVMCHGGVTAVLLMPAANHSEDGPNAQLCYSRADREPRLTELRETKSDTAPAPMPRLTERDHGLWKEVIATVYVHVGSEDQVGFVMTKYIVPIPLAYT